MKLGVYGDAVVFHQFNLEVGLRLMQTIYHIRGILELIKLIYTRSRCCHHISRLSREFPIQLCDPASLLPPLISISGSISTVIFCPYFIIRRFISRLAYSKTNEPGRKHKLLEPSLLIFCLLNETSHAEIKLLMRSNINTVFFTLYRAIYVNAQINLCGRGP